MPDNIKGIQTYECQKRDPDRTHFYHQAGSFVTGQKHREYYEANWIERLNKEFRRTFKIRNSMPSFESALTLLSKVAMDKEDGYMSYPIYNFKFDKKLNDRM